MAGSASVPSLILLFLMAVIPYIVILTAVVCLVVIAIKLYQKGKKK